jgi:hypothetical protein
MSLSSKAKKVKAKGSVRELKLVQSISRSGANIIKTEEVKTPHPASTSQRNNSSSPTKRRKIETFNGEPIPCYLEGTDMFKRRTTLVFIFSS